MLKATIIDKMNSNKAITLKQTAIAEAMLLNLSDKVSKTEFNEAWYSEKSYNKHVVKRTKLGEIVDAADYEAKTRDVIANAQKLIVVTPTKGMISGKLQIISNGWIVLIGEEGKIITSYPFDENKLSFEQRHIDNGDIVYEYFISSTIKKILNGI